MALLSAVYSTAKADVKARLVLGAQPLAGFQYYAGKQVWDELKVGEALTLIREPDNAHDPQAIRVEWRGIKLGYVPRTGNQTIAQFLDRGAKVSGRIVNLHASRRHWQRILFEVVVEE